jgi:hypothetical protein
LGASRRRMHRVQATGKVDDCRVPAATTLNPS